VSDSKKTSIETATAVCQVLLATEPMLVNESVIRAAIGDAVVATLPAVADVFGVSPNTVKQSWRQGGMPGAAKSYPIADIAIWYLQRQVANAEQRVTSTSDFNKQLADIELRKAEADTRLRELKLSETEDQLVARATVQSEVAMLLGVLREQLLGVPRQMTPMFPVAQAEDLTTEVERMITRSLIAITEKLSQLSHEISESNHGEEDNEQEQPDPKSKRQRKRAKSR
jgi:phage terminase Nu1 subunit (DNA packaging protein)